MGLVAFYVEKIITLVPLNHLSNNQNCKKIKMNSSLGNPCPYWHSVNILTRIDRFWGKQSSVTLIRFTEIRWIKLKYKPRSLTWGRCYDRSLFHLTMTWRVLVTFCAFISLAWAAGELFLSFLWPKTTPDYHQIAIQCYLCHQVVLRVLVFLLLLSFKCRCPWSGSFGR